MADTKISDMTASTDLNGDIFPVVEAGANKTGAIDSDGTLAANSDAKVPTQKAVKTYADTKAAGTHTHAISDTTGLQAALDGKAASSHTHTVSHISDLTATATELNYTDGVTSAIQTQLNGKADSSHNHAASAITSGTIDTARLGSGTANSSSYLRGDQTWATIAGGGDVVGNDTSVTVQNIVAYAHTGGKQITELTGTGGDMLIYDGSTSAWLKLARGTFGQVLSMNSGSTSPEWAYGGLVHSSKSSGATTTGANTTPVSVSGAVFDYVANAVYKIWIMGRVNSTAATTGIGLQFDLSSAVTAIDVQFFHQLASTGTLTGGHSIADDASVGVSSGVPAGPIDVPVTGHGLLVTGANTGTCQLRLRSETTAVTELMAGTVMLVWRVA